MFVKIITCSLEGILFNCCKKCFYNSSLPMCMHCNNKSFIEHRVDHKEIGEDIILKADLKCSTPKELEELVCR